MTVRMGLLALLEAGPSHGYQLKAAFEARTGGVWSLNVGQVYSTLDRLGADGLVEALPAEDERGTARPGGRDRRPWRLTPAGKAALDDWFDAVSVEAAPPRDEFLAKVLLACGRSRDEALAVIDRQRAELYRLAGAERRRRRATGPAAGPPDPAGDATDGSPADGGGGTDHLAGLAADLMAEVVAARHEADLRWLDHCETVLLSRDPEGTP